MTDQHSALRHLHADALFAENHARLPGNLRLGEVLFPNGSVAVLPGELHVSVTREALR